jgi:folate-binding protein YgfZ
MTAKAFIVLGDRGVISVVGADTSTFLQGLISNDINKVDASHAIYATLLTAQGKFLHDFFIAATPDGDGVLIDCERGRLDDLLRRLTMYKLRAAVDLSDVSSDFDVVALLGPDSLADAGLPPEPGAARPLGGGIVFTDPRIAEMGARAILAAETGVGALTSEGFTPGNADDYRTLRLTLGLPDGSHDIVVDKNFPLECGFEELNAIDYEKGCYVGQELTARTHYRGKIRKRLMPVVIDGPLPEPGTAVMHGEREVGEIRSGAADRAIALIRIEPFEAAQQKKEFFTAGSATVTPIKPDWASF